MPSSLLWDRNPQQTDALARGMGYFCLFLHMVCVLLVWLMTSLAAAVVLDLGDQLLLVSFHVALPSPRFYSTPHLRLQSQGTINIRWT